MPRTPIKADHTIATPRSSSESGGRSVVDKGSGTAAPDKSKPKSPITTKPGSPVTTKPPSPVTTKPPSPIPGGLRTKTPSPTPFGARMGPERKSPSGGQRLSPTQVKGAISPTAELSKSSRLDAKIGAKKGQGQSPEPPESLPALQPMPPTGAYPGSGRSSKRNDKGRGRGHSELLRKPIAAPAPALDTRDSATQTQGLCDAGTQTWIAPKSFADEQCELSTRKAPADVQNEGWLDSQIALQSELVMAVTSSMELIAENSIGSFAAARAAAGPKPSRTTRSVGCDQGSDSECDENAEVRSLSLSEEGPVVIASAADHVRNKRHAAAPDPVAMLGEKHKGLRDHERGGARGRGDLLMSDELEDELGLGLQNDSDHSAATTRMELDGNTDPCARSPPNLGQEIADMCSPIMSKVGSLALEAVPEQSNAPGGALPTTKLRKVPSTKLKPLPALAADSKGALHLSQVKLACDDTARPPSARSDVSIGSACSAFSSYSGSTSGSHVTSPRCRGLKTSASTPAMSSRSVGEISRGR